MLDAPPQPRGQAAAVGVRRALRRSALSRVGFLTGMHHGLGKTSSASRRRSNPVREPSPTTALSSGPGRVRCRDMR